MSADMLLVLLGLAFVVGFAALGASEALGCVFRGRDSADSVERAAAASRAWIDQRYAEMAVQELPDSEGIANCVLTTDGNGWFGWERMPFPPPHITYTQTKCPSCGSREWTPHAGKEVCAYCRSDRA